MAFDTVFKIVITGALLWLCIKAVEWLVSQALHWGRERENRTLSADIGVRFK
jgi:hypothetical protein